MNLSAAQMDRAIGALVGAACGDALGAGYEFGVAELIGRPAMIGGGLGNFAPGEWTDDTAQTYAIARVTATGVDLRERSALDAVAAGFHEWFGAGPPDVGSHTRAVLTRANGDPSAAQMRSVSDALHQAGALTGGNGTLMRTAPVALAYLDDPDTLVEAVVAVATLTHHDPVGGDACVLWCLAIRHAILSGELPDLLELVPHLPGERQEFWRAMVRDAQEHEPSDFARNGYVVTAFQAAWSAIVHTPVPEERPADGSFRAAHLVAGLETAVGIGHDTDTVASIAGALLGARWGYSAVPWSWRRIVHGWPAATVDDLADLAVLTARGGRSDAHGWPTAPRLDYVHERWRTSLAVHPHDPGVILAGVAALDDPPPDVTAVVSLCRLGREQVPPSLVQASFRIIDTGVEDNPNLAYAVDDAARTVRSLRDEGHVVLLHCVAAQSRTPTVAARYATLLGRPVDEAFAQVCAVLPEASPRPALRAAVERCVGGRA